MIDIHTHILPGIDDGSPNMETSLRMLEIMSKRGVTDVFATPHYIIGEYDNPADKVAESLRNLNRAVEEARIDIKVHFGVELYLMGDIAERLNLDDYCLGDSKYILVETALNGFPINILEILYKIVKKGYKPIFAHTERYTDVIKNIDIVEDLVYRNVYIQVNAGSFLGLLGDSVAKTAWAMLQRGLVHFIASDCHCRSEIYTLPDAKKVLKESYPDYPIDSFTDTNPAAILNNEEIKYFNTPISVVNERKENIFSRILKLFYEK